MARPRRRTRNPQQNPRNMGNNRVASVRGNNRNLGQNQPFQGGVGQGVAPQVPGQAPGQPLAQGMQQCPQGQVPGVNPDTGAPICKPAQANIAGTVPVINSQRATNPGPKGNVPPRPKRGYNGQA